MDNVLKRLQVFAGFVAVLCLVYFQSLRDLVGFALKTDLYSHVLLVPFICGYLVNLQRPELPRQVRTAVWPGVGFLVAGLGLALGYLLAARAGLRLSVNDYLAWVVFSFVCCVAGAAFLCFGTALMRKVAFPACFAVFLVPFPEVWNNFWEMFFQHASAEAANLLFVVSGTPTFRHGLIFGLPGITIEVAQECSGTRSSFVLLLTGLLAGHLFLRTRWKKALLAAAIVPIGIARNALRIFSIAMLCVHIEPGMINSFIHKRGGPFFFVVSLVPFFALLLWFRKSESRPTKPGSDKPKH